MGTFTKTETNIERVTGYHITMGTVTLPCGHVITEADITAAHVPCPNSGQCGAKKCTLLNFIITPKPEVEMGFIEVADGGPVPAFVGNLLRVSEEEGLKDGQND